MECLPILTTHYFGASSTPRRRKSQTESRSRQRYLVGREVLERRDERFEEGYVLGNNGQFSSTSEDFDKWNSVLKFVSLLQIICETSDFKFAKVRHKRFCFPFDFSLKLTNSFLSYLTTCIVMCISSPVSPSFSNRLHNLTILLLSLRFTVPKKCRFSSSFWQ